jgi:hypothetical protein
MKVVYTSESRPGLSVSSSAFDYARDQLVQIVDDFRRLDSWFGWNLSGTPKAFLSSMPSNTHHLTEDPQVRFRRLRLPRPHWISGHLRMLAYVNDKLIPQGFDEIVKDDFAALHQMLERH